MQKRKLNRVINAQPSSDGDGVKIFRVGGSSNHSLIDPFLMIDEIRSQQGSDYIGGFPSHPHRGFETITYMIAGRMRHKDHMGNEGVLDGGDVQWMTAARGVIHSEMPEQQEGLLHGFQLWLNLPASEKMLPADYHDYKGQRLPAINLAGSGVLKVVAGSAIVEGQVITSPVKTGSTEPFYWDVQLEAGQQFEQQVPSDHLVAVYVYEGGSHELSARQLGVYGEGDTLAFMAGSEGLKALVIGGLPIREPIAQYGPFVMNSMDEIEQAISDYQQGRLTGS